MIYFTNTFLPLMMFTPFCGWPTRCPARLKISPNCSALTVCVSEMPVVGSTNTKVYARTSTS